MTYVAGYIAILIAFTIADAVWLTNAGPALYKPTLGDILAADIRMAPAVVFYLSFPVFVMIFAVVPAHKADSTAMVFLLGALLGAFAYGTYELSNFATLRNWTWQIVVIDIAYGAAMTAVVSFAGLSAMRLAQRFAGG